MAGLAGIGLLLTGSALAQPAQIATQTQLTANVAHTPAGTRATFAVHVTPSGGDVNAGGVVTLIDGGRQIGSAILNAAGDATLTVTGLLPGAHAVHAEFEGNDGSDGGGTVLAGSFSAETDVTAEATGVATFTAAATPTALKVPQGTTGTTTITLVPVNGFSNYVTLSCSSLPPDTACTFLPVNVFVGNAKAATTVMSLETFAPTSKTGMVRRQSTMVYAFLLPGLLGLAGLGMRRRSEAWKHAGLMLLMFAGIGMMTGMMSGCGALYHYLNKSPTPSPGTALGSTTIVVEAQATSGVVVTTQLIKNVVLTVTAPPS